MDFSFFTLLFDVYSGNVFNFIAEFIASWILVYFQATSGVCVGAKINTHTHSLTAIYVYIMYERAYAVTILFVKHSTHIENWISRGGKIYIQIAANIVALRNKEKKEKTEIF